MGNTVDPAALTDSGERCLRRVSDLYLLHLAAEHFAVVAMAPVEVHVTSVIHRLIGSSPESDTDFGRALIEHIDSGFVDNWPSRMKWLKNGFGLTIVGNRPYQDLRLVIELRNAMVHGDGQLTEKQVGQIRTLRSDLAKGLSVSCQGRILQPSASTAENTLRVIRSFVADFDAVVMRVYPAARF